MNQLNAVKIQAQEDSARDMSFCKIKNNGWQLWYKLIISFSCNNILRDYDKPDYRMTGKSKRRVFCKC